MLKHFAELGSLTRFDYFFHICGIFILISCQLINTQIGVRKAFGQQMFMLHAQAVFKENLFFVFHFV